MFIGLIPHLEKPEALAACGQLVEWLEAQDIKPCLPGAVGTYLQRPDLAVDKKTMAAKSDMLVVLGGDGTLLSVVRRYAPWELPILGINLGKLGFLTAIEATDMFAGMERVLKGDCSIQERMLLRVKVVREGTIVKDLHALNDIVISKGGFSRMLVLGMAINGQSLNPLPADGIIVATPTGSTAYSLSAGGPIVDPDISVLLITPICPHSLQSRPLVVASDSEVQINVEAQNDTVLLTIDGQESFALEPRDRVLVSRANEVARLLKVSNNSFYDVLQQKLAGDFTRYRGGKGIC